MSSQLASIVPPAPLTDAVFPFNQDHFQELRKQQKKDLEYVSSKPVQALLNGPPIGEWMGSPLGNGTTDIDPALIVNKHVEHSTAVNDKMPAVIETLDKSMQKFSQQIGTRSEELYGNIGTKGAQIITEWEGNLTEVNGALSELKGTMTKGNLQEEISIGQEKYLSARPDKSAGLPQHSLGPIDKLLPQAVQTTQDVTAAFETIGANLKQAKDKINEGETDPKRIFLQSAQEVTASWQAFEAKRKTMSDIPYKSTTSSQDPLPVPASGFPTSTKMGDSVYDIAVVQSRLFGDSKGNQFNDLEKVIGYPANVSINVNKPLVELVVMHGGVIDGITFSYLKNDGQTVNMNHGTSEACPDPGLKKTRVSLKTGCENIIAITGREDGIRVTQLSFVIYDSSNGTARIAGPFGGQSGTPFRVTANGNFVACAGFAIDTNSSVGQLNPGQDGGLYGLTFSEIAYRCA